MTTGKVPTEAKKLMPRLREHPLATLREEMDDLFSRLLASGEEGWFAGRLCPSLDMSETDSTLEVKMDLPGVKPEEIDIRMSGNTLTVSGERQEESEEKGKTFHRVERRVGKFSRTMTLPCPVDERKVDAKYRDGVLTISLSKTAEAQTHKIKVKTETSVH